MRKGLLQFLLVILSSLCVYAQGPTVITKNITVNLSPAGTITILPSDVDNGSSADAGIQSMSLSKTSFNCSDVGSNTVTLTVTDNNSVAATGNATVTVVDNTSPNAICKNVEKLPDASGNVIVTPDDIDNGSSDACGIASRTLSHSNFSCSNLTGFPSDIVISNPVVRNWGGRTVTYSNFRINGGGNVSGVAPGSSVSVSFNWSNNGSWDVYCPGCVVQWYIGINNVVTSGFYSGNTASYFTGTHSFSFTAPSTPGTYYFNMNWSLDFFYYSSVPFATGPVGAIGAIVVGNETTLQVTDNNSNTSSCNALVFIKDLPPTVITKPATVYLDAEGNGTLSVTDIDNGISDACGIKSMVLSKTTFDCSNIGINTVTITVTDNNDYVATGTAAVNVIPAINNLIITNTIGRQTSGQPFNITVQTPFCNGNPVNVSSNTPVTIAIETGNGTVTGSGTITTGNHSVTISVIYTNPVGENGVQLKAVAAGYNNGISNAFNLTAEEPYQQARSITFSSVYCNSISFRWFNGSGDNYLVLARQGNSLTDLPGDNTTYSANSIYGAGDNIGSAFVVYKGSNRSTTVTGLSQGTQYTFKVINFNGSDGNENYSLISGGSFNPRTRNTSSCKTSLFDIGTEIANFEGRYYGKSIILKWRSLYEQNINGFELYRSDIDEENFVKVGSYYENPSLASTGSRMNEKKYSFIDNDGSLEPGKPYIYKIVSIGIDGSQEELSETLVTINDIQMTGNNDELYVSDINPNPVTDMLHFNIRLLNHQKVKIEILDMAGRRVSCPVDGKSFESGVYNFELPFENMAAGVYMLNVISGTESKMQKFVYVPR